MGGVGRALLALAFTVAGCSSSNPAPQSASATIGSAGGTVSLPGVDLVIPPGALGASQTITISAPSNSPPAAYLARSPLFRFEPPGLTFDVAATVRVTFSGDPASTTVYWSQIGADGYDDLGGQASGTTVSAAVTHFSSGFAGARAENDLGMPPDLSSNTDLASPPDQSSSADGGACAGAGQSCVAIPCCSLACASGVCAPAARSPIAPSRN